METYKKIMSYLKKYSIQKNYSQLIYYLQISRRIIASKYVVTNFLTLRNPRANIHYRHKVWKQYKIFRKIRL